MQPGMPDCCLICADSFLLRRRFEELKLHQPFDVTPAMGRCMRLHMPEQQPLIRAEVK
jgi:hypothetical protein